MTTSSSEAMRKRRLSVYLEPAIMAELEAYADRRGRSLSLVAEAAIASFVTPDESERQEAALSARLDRLNRTQDRLERDQSIAIETLALFVRHWLTVMPVPPEAHRDAAQQKGGERYDGFLEALGRRLAKGSVFRREIAEEMEREDEDDAGRA
ncbi:CopG family transcriptional regulator [Aestuariibius insulae]|uniref:CopG family transcriptional regulator n=1 Tax=Aestuariibius insulae TaxID=2058287 RepID=UPI00345EFC5A